MRCLSPFVIVVLLQLLHGYVLSSSSNDLLNAVLNCLSSLTKRLTQRLHCARDSCMANTKDKVIIVYIVGTGYAHEFGDFQSELITYINSLIINVTASTERSLVYYFYDKR